MANEGRFRARHFQEPSREMTRKAVETAALWKPWKNGAIEKTTPGLVFFHRSHSAWKTPPDGVSHSHHRFDGGIHKTESIRSASREGFTKDRNESTPRI